MAYPSRYYDMQQAVMRDVGFSVRTGLCPVCRIRRSGTWPDGKRRITCGSNSCFIKWLPIQTAEKETNNA